MWLRLRNVEKKDVCPLLLLENSRPLSSPWEPQTPLSSLGTPDFLSTCLGINSLIPLFSYRRIMLLRERGVGRNYFLLRWDAVPKLLRQHILLTLILRVSDPGAPSSSWRRLWHLEEVVALVGAWTTICNLKAFRRLETNPILQL